MAVPGKRRDPQVAFCFRLEIQSIEGGMFTKVSGLKNETDIFELSEGGNNEFVVKLVGQSRASNLVLTNGLITDTDLFKWREEIVNGGANKIKRRSGSVVALADDGKTELGRWNFQNAWPVRWEMSEFDSSVSAASCQVLELAVERIVKA